MREIKFRAWDKIHKEMSTWSSLYDNLHRGVFTLRTEVICSTK